MSERHEVLAAAAAALAHTRDVAGAGRALEKLFVPDFADVGVLCLGPELARDGFCQTLAGASIALDFAHGALAEAVAGRTFLLPDVGAMTELAAGDQSLADLFASTRARSLLLVPLAARDLRGAMLWLSSSRSFEARDAELAAALAPLVALALAGARAEATAEDVIRARNEVIDLVAHDLRSPLNGVLLTIEYLTEKLGQIGADDLVDPWVTGIADSMRAMNRTIAELLELVRLESGQTKLGSSRLDLNYVIERALRTLHAEHPGVGLAVERGQALPAVNGDEQRLAQAMACLAADLVKFRSDDRDARVSLRISAKGPHAVELALHEPSPPQPSDELDHLFDRFWRPCELDRRGAALGLSIASAIVKRLGGTLRAEGGPEGMTFRFTLGS